MRRSARIARPELGAVLDDVGVIDVVCAPRGLAVPVSEPVIYDPSSEAEFEADVVVLGVGVGAAGAPGLVRRAEAAGAVAIKLDAAAPKGLVAEAERVGVALLSVPTEMTWTQVHRLLLTALATIHPDPSDRRLVQAPPGDEDAGGVPLGDLFALANAVAAMVGGPVTIEDRRSHVLAYSTLSEGIDEPRRETILGRRVPAEWLRRLEEAGVFERLWRGEVVRYEADAGFDLKPRIALAVRAGEVILGSIWVAEGDRPLPPHATDALREAARIAALHMIRHRAAGDLDRAARGEELREVLEDAVAAERAASRLGVRAKGAFAVLAFEPVVTDEAEGALQRERTLDLIALHGEAFRRWSAAVELAGTIYVLLPDAVPERLLDLARDVVERAERSIGVGLRAGAGPVVQHLREVARSRHEADLVLGALAEGDGRVGDVASVHERIALNEIRDLVARRPLLRSRPLEVLGAHDAEHATSYVATLRAYLDALGNVTAAASKLGVHPNSFRYRLRRLCELSGIDLSDPEQRLLAELDLHLGLVS